MKGRGRQVVGIALAAAVTLAPSPALAASQQSAQAPAARQTGTTTSVREPTVRLDVKDFCCIDYILVLQRSVAAKWNARQDDAAAATIKFVIERKGKISRAEVEQSSGIAAFDARALRAVRETKLSPLPSAFVHSTLVVHLTFPAAQADSASTSSPVNATVVAGSDTETVNFTPWLRQFMAQVKRNWFVPQAAATVTGGSVVQFAVTKAGEIRNITLVTSSGVPEFDRAAVNALVSSNPLQPLPSGYRPDEAQFTVNFTYNPQPAKP